MFPGAIENSEYFNNKLNKIIILVKKEGLSLRNEEYKVYKIMEEIQVVFMIIKSRIIIEENNLVAGGRAKAEKL